MIRGRVEGDQRKSRGRRAGRGEGDQGEKRVIRGRVEGDKRESLGSRGRVEGNQRKSRGRSEGE